MFPYILDKINPYFHFPYSKFGVQKSKDSTARVALFKEMRIPNIFTLESTFCGNDKGPNAGKHINQSALESIGRDLCRSLLLYCGIQVPDQFGVETKTEGESPAMPSKKYTEDTLAIKSQLLNELKGNTELINKGEGSSSSGSDDAPSEDNLDAEEICQLVPPIDKKLKAALKKVKKGQWAKERKAEEERLAKEKMLEKARKIEEEEKKAKPV